MPTILKSRSLDDRDNYFFARISYWSGHWIFDQVIFFFVKWLKFHKNMYTKDIKFK